MVWDEDHDDGIIQVIERLYRACMLPGFMMFGERKGTLTAVMSEEYRAPVSIKLGEIAWSPNDDAWIPVMCGINDSDLRIIDAPTENVRLYLRNIQMLWQLGSHPIL